jgi:hypothetical protein
VNHKKTGTKTGPGIVLAGCPDKIDKPSFKSDKVSKLQSKLAVQPRLETQLTLKL